MAKNEERLIIVWFDPNFGSQYHPKQSEQQLCLINDYVIFFIDLNQCIKFIRTEEKDKIFLIISESYALQILPHVNSLDQIHSIFIFSMNNNRYENLIDQYPKIIGIYDLDELCKSIKNQIEFVNNQLQTFSFLNPYQQSTKNLSKSSAEFLWFQLFKQIITQLPETKQTKQEMIQMCKRYYHTNTKQLQLIKQFDKEYQPDAAIRWYSKKTFIYKLINKALRDKDIEQLQTFRFFIDDLSLNLYREHDKILSSNEHLITVYRGIKLDKKKFDEIKKNQGKLISMNGYFLASRLRQKAREFAIIPTKQTDMISVLFQIECHVNQLGKSIIFADIAQFSTYPNEQEVLFNLNACFHIKSIEQNGLLQVINMDLSNEGKTIITYFIDETENEIEEKCDLIVFGKLLCDLGQYDQSKKYFEQLLKNQKDKNTSWIEFNLGRVFALKRNWKNAREHYDCAYNQMKESLVSIKYTARVQSNIGDILRQQENNDEALYYYEQAVKVGEKYYQFGHVDIADYLNSIAIILADQVRFNEAIHYYQRALKMREKCCPFDHVKITENLICIGNIFYRQGKYNEALDYHQQALRIRKQYYRSGHIDIAHSLNNVGNILDQQGKYDEGLDYLQQALEIKRKCNPPCHVDIATSLNNIGVCYENQNKIKMALDHYRQALDIYKKSIPGKHQNRIRIERNIRRLTGEE
jgi:tetratricopeptide (TPR) repeat protein